MKREVETLGQFSHFFFSEIKGKRMLSTWEGKAVEDSFV